MLANAVVVFEHSAHNTNHKLKFLARLKLIFYVGIRSRNVPWSGLPRAVHSLPMLACNGRRSTYDLGSHETAPPDTAVRLFAAKNPLLWRRSDIDLWLMADKDSGRKPLDRSKLLFHVRSNIESLDPSSADVARRLRVSTAKHNL